MSAILPPIPPPPPTEEEKEALSISTAPTEQLPAALVPLPSDPMEIERVFRYAGFGIRFLAFIVDGFLLALVLAIPFWAVSWALYLVPIAAVLVNAAIGVAVGWVYFAALESSPRQATLGKMLLGLCVTDLNGVRVSLPRASLRYVGKACSTLVFCVGFVTICFSRRRQALHDMLAGCLVIRK